ncbi:MAG: CDP-2,3-bis-(O-geranylgeranyl)-sn-glycerol synthase [Candidatus Micrarchaeota archaeon]
MNPLEIILFILPAYVANATPVLLRGKTPIDFGTQLGDKQRIFGQNKTIKGFIAGVAGGTVTGIIITLLFPQIFPTVSTNDKILIYFLLSLGAMLGDLIGSFVKRRRGMQSGSESLVMDKILFVIIALVVAYPAYSGKINLLHLDAVIIVALTYLLHIAFNKIAHYLKLKKVPW